MKVGIIRVVSLREEGEIARHGKLIERAFPNLKTVSRCIEGLPHGVHDEETERLAAERVPQLAKELEGEVEAIIVSCVADPGVERSKREVGVPVVGAGESLAYMAQAVGRRVGVLTITDGVPGPLRDRLEDFVWKKVEGVRTTLDLEGKEHEILECARQLCEEGCDVIALGCTGFSTISVAPKISKRLGVAVLDPVVAAGSVAYGILISKGGTDGPERDP